MKKKICNDETSSAQEFMQKNKIDNKFMHRNQEEIEDYDNLNKIDIKNKRN